jgi:hypothetical protein
MNNKNLFWTNESKCAVVIRVMMFALVNILLLFLLLPHAYAADFNNSGISLTSNIDSIAYSFTDGTTSVGGYGGTTVTGNFTNTGLNAFIGLLEFDFSYTPLNVSLSSPVNNSGTIGNSVTFRYYVEDNTTVANCTLYIDGIKTAFSSSILPGQNTFSVNDISIASHIWNITCEDIDGSKDGSSNNMFTVSLLSTFGNESTDLSQVDMRNVTNLTISKSGKGKIVFTGSTNISQGADFDSYVKILDKSIIVDSNALPFLNKSAVLTMYNVPFDNIIIWKDGSVCSSCNILSNSDDTLVFSVAGFSNYTVTSTSKLDVYDDTDSNGTLQNESITFTANYTNVTSGTPISASCNIIIENNGTYAMDYNSTSLVYQYASSFEETGTRYYTVQCTPQESGFDALEINSTFIISTLPPPSFAGITAEKGNSSSMSSNNSPAIIYSAASNLTELAFDMQVTTKTWQGYYGKVTGQVQLKDSNASSLYNWNLVSPSGEVYATRSPTVEWTNVRCANMTELEIENNVLGVNSTDGDSVTNTFHNASSFDEFFVGSVRINTSQDCYATHLNDNTGVQDINYAEILLSDSSLMLYTSILDPGTIGFDGSNYDFEMLVGENGHNDNTAPTTYYFYIEIG